MPDSRIYVAGHTGMVGSAIMNRLKQQGYENIVTHSHAELDLLDQKAVRFFFQQEQIDCVILAAAKVGGILANATFPADFIYQNLVIQNNVIHEAWQAGVQNLLFLGSSCIYPKFAPQPMKEECLLGGPLEPTNEPYAIAKIAGIKMCEAYNRQYGTSYFAVMPTNLYGTGDYYGLQNSHVLPALIRKMHDAKIRGQKEVVLWGTGTARREFLHCADLADAVVFLLSLERELLFSSLPLAGSPLINIGYGKDITIHELADMIAGIVGFTGKISWDVTKPDGTPRKLLDVSRINALGWQPVISLSGGIQDTYINYLSEMVEA
ncbi:MAG: GDP-L-fucose synthase [Proteobacteria bacterium]|nr:GDP-L-fucose synthase [Pseudomonadota bacterium]MBU1650496.1 GDP-L-fucose synthase [Pseudomonadota bacterium]